MKRKNLFVATLVIVAGMLTITSCENLKTDDSNLLSAVEIESAEDDAFVDDVFSNLDSEIDLEIASLDFADYETSILKSTDEEPYTCKSVTVDRPDSTIFPKVITIDYGEGCTIEINGETFTRKGKIIITITNRCFMPDAARSVEFVDFYINDMKIEGTRTTVNKGENAEGNLEFQMTLVGGKIIFNDTLEYTREAEKTREWVRAENPIDDIWYVTGGCNGVNLDGYEYSHTIIEKLMIIRCEEFNYRRAIVQGVVEIVRNGETSIIDYGDGTCDDAAILSRNGEQKEIKIRNRYHKRRKLFADVSGR